jgi:flagellin
MGSFSILNNISGLAAQNQLEVTNVNLSQTLLRLSSGKRINSGADDAAGRRAADLTKYQILAQAGIGTLVQANQNSQSVLTLLRNG